MLLVEQNYNIYDKELLTIVVLLQYQRIYCEGALQLTILSDYKNLTYFTTTKELTRRQSRQLEILKQYKFEIQYTLGKDNTRADALSRRPDYIEGKELISYAILKTNLVGTLSTNPQEFNTTLRILRDKKEEFPIKHRKFSVPKQHIQQYIQDYYDNPTYGYLGVVKILQLIKRRFIFLEIRTQVTIYIKRYVPYQKNKSVRYLKYGNLLFSILLVESQEEVTINFIIRLLPSIEAYIGVSYDIILVIVDRLTKYIYFIPCKVILIAKQLGFLVLDRLIRYYRIPKIFIIDRDKLFTLAYQRTLVV